MAPGGIIVEIPEPLRWGSKLSVKDASGERVAAVEIDRAEVAVWGLQAGEHTLEVRAMGDAPVILATGGAQVRSGAWSRASLRLEPIPVISLPPGAIW